MLIKMKYDSLERLCKKKLFGTYRPTELKNTRQKLIKTYFKLKFGSIKMKENSCSNTDNK